MFHFCSQKKSFFVKISLFMHRLSFSDNCTLLEREEMGGKELEYSSNQQFIKLKWSSGSEDVHYTLFCDDLPEDIIKNALLEAKETEENRADGIRSLKEFMRKKKLTCSDDMLITVLRTCKYNIKQSESKLEKLLKVRQMVIRKLAGYNIKDFEPGLDEMGAGLFPYRAADGRALLFARTLENFGAYETDFVLTYLLGFILFFLYEVPASFLGVIYIADSSTPSMPVWYLLLKLYRRLLPNLLSLPIKLGKIEVANEHFLVRWFYHAVRPFIPRKIADRITFLGQGYENLRKYYHPDILPNEFGGNLGPLNDTHFRKKFLDFMEKLKAENDNINP